MTDLSNHPLLLHADSLVETPPAPQTQFVAERQVAIQEALAVTANARTAARRARRMVSHPE